MDRFIARENIKHLRNRLWSESEAATRGSLQKLLVEEEDKLGASFELLADLERHIDDGHRRIERQRILVATLERDGHDGLPTAQTLLAVMLDTQLLHSNYRDQVLTRIERNRL